MGNCAGSRRVPDTQEPIADMDKIIKDLAWDKLSTRRLTYAEKLCLEKSIKLEVC